MASSMSAGLRRPQHRIGKPHAITLMVAGLVVIGLAELVLGPVRLDLSQILDVLLGEGAAVPTAIIEQIRAPRTLLGICVGAGLALSGCALQGVLRNPLADPGLIGITGGASAAAVTMIVLGGGLLPELATGLRPFALPVAAFLGALLVTGFVFALARRSEGTSVALLILAGVAVQAISVAIIGTMAFISDDRQLREMTFWTLGSIGRGSWPIITVTAITVTCASGILLRLGRSLDLFQMGERAAFHSGLDVEAAKRRIALCSALAVGAATAAAGPIGFIGLVAPHMARLLVGPAHRYVLPAAALIGASLVLAADLAVRLAVPPAEPPIGLATSLLGGPFFLWLLMTRFRKGGISA